MDRIFIKAEKIKTVGAHWIRLKLKSKMKKKYHKSMLQYFILECTSIY